MNINYQETSRSVHYVWLNVYMTEYLRNLQPFSSSSAELFPTPFFSSSSPSFALNLALNSWRRFVLSFIMRLFLRFESLGSRRDRITRSNGSARGGALWWWSESLNLLSEWSLNTAMCRLCVKQHQHTPKFNYSCRDFTHHHVVGVLLIVTRTHRGLFKLLFNAFCCNQIFCSSKFFFFSLLPCREESVLVSSTCERGEFLQDIEWKSEHVELRKFQCFS